MQNHKQVIPFPSGWRYFDYRQGAGNPIEDWYQGLSEEGQYKFDSLLKANQKAEQPAGWTGSKKLHGECAQEKVWEWTFYADGRQQRVLGICGDQRKQVIFLIGCSHKGKVYTPHDCLKTAIKRAKEVRSGRAPISERKVEQDL